MKQTKLETGYFYCVVTPDGNVSIFNAAFYRKQAIDNYLRHIGWHQHKDWNELKKQGYKCLKFKITEWNKYDLTNY